MPFQSCKKCGADLTTLLEVKEYCVGCTPENMEPQTTDTPHSNGAEPAEIFCDDICEYCQNNRPGNDACVECSCGDSENEEYIHFVGKKLRHC